MQESFWLFEPFLKLFPIYFQFFIILFEHNLVNDYDLLKSIEIRLLESRNEVQ